MAAITPARVALAFLYLPASIAYCCAFACAYDTTSDLGADLTEYPCCASAFSKSFYNTTTSVLRTSTHNTHTLSLPQLSLLLALSNATSAIPHTSADDSMAPSALSCVSAFFPIFSFNLVNILCRQVVGEGGE